MTSTVCIVSVTLFFDNRWRMPALAVAQSGVSVGTVVDRDSVVCLIEAMKVFNEIKAEVDGTIEKIVTHNEEPVEYGQALFYVRPS